MKIVVNRSYGSFAVSQYFLSEWNKTHDAIGQYEAIEYRLDNDFIELVEMLTPMASSGPHSHLEVVSLPDSCTDFKVLEYDGFEHVAYVQNGKLFFA